MITTTAAPEEKAPNTGSALRAPFRLAPLRGEVLRTVVYFRHIEDARAESLTQILEGRIYAERREIVSQLDQQYDVFFLLSGRVQATTFSRSGRVITFQELRQGEMFGEMSAIDGLPRTANVTCLSECFVAKMSSTSWWDLVHNDPKFAESAFKRLSSLARHLCERIAEFHALSVADRVKLEIYRLAQHEQPVSNRVTISPSPTQAELASRAGTHREAVTREISELTRRGIVRQHRKTLYIEDYEAFEQLVIELVQSPGAPLAVDSN